MNNELFYGSETLRRKPEPSDDREWRIVGQFNMKTKIQKNSHQTREYISITADLTGKQMSVQQCWQSNLRGQYSVMPRAKG